MSRRPKQGNSTAAARMANHDLMDNPPYLGAGGATNVEVEDDLSGNMLETCIDDTVSLSDPKEGGKHEKKGSTAMIADQRKGVVIQDKGEQHKPRKLKQRKNKPEFVSTTVHWVLTVTQVAV
uniref:Uncharacterized protein n=1 Tax=Magallana gigas TaxID=29159 RepID=K1P8B4_MAGGI